MQNLLPTSLLAAALLFTGGNLAVAHSQQLQSDGTYSQATPQQQQQTQAPSQPADPVQNGGARHAPNPARETKRLSRQLGLTPDQASLLQPILADRDSRMAALRADTTLDPKTKHRQGHAIQADTQGKINGLLTPAQQQQYADMRAAHRHNQGGTAPAPTSGV